MKSTTLQKNARHLRRRRSVRRRIRMTTDRLRLSVNRSLKHISAQIIDDATGRTLCSVASTSKALAGNLEGKTKTEKAKVIGAEMARKAKEAGVGTVVLDRGAAKYHGRVKAFAEAARKGGLKF